MQHVVAVQSAPHVRSLRKEDPGVTQIDDLHRFDCICHCPHVRSASVVGAGVAPLAIVGDDVGVREGVGSTGAVPPPDSHPGTISFAESSVCFSQYSV